MRPDSLDSPRVPSGTAIRHADLATWRSERGLCPECAAPVNEEGGCDVCREEGQRCECNPAEPTTPQCVLDAQADAECLLLWLRCGEGWNWQGGWSLATAAAAGPVAATLEGYRAKDTAAYAARAAFRAVPELRG